MHGLGTTGAAAAATDLLKTSETRKLLQLANGHQLGMRVEHQVEKPGAAVAQARDEDNLHSSRFPPFQAH
jgi:hypothetical protein